jgi:hypothetical protein
MHELDLAFPPTFHGSTRFPSFCHYPTKRKFTFHYVTCPPPWGYINGGSAPSPALHVMDSPVQFAFSIPQRRGDMRGILGQVIQDVPAGMSIKNLPGKDSWVGSPPSTASFQSDCLLCCHYPANCMCTFHYMACPPLWGYINGGSGPSPGP